MDFLINSNWWFQLIAQTIISAIILIVVKKIYLKLSTNITNPFNKKGFIGKKIRRLRLKDLKKVKNIRLDKVRISQEIVKKYAYLTIFIISVLIYFWLIICLTILSEDFRIYTNTKTWIYNFFVIIVGSPIYIFELLYLNQKDFVEKIFKYRKNQ